MKLNCAAMPHELIESELFGHEKGAFTGAVARRAAASSSWPHGGTLFLDEIGDMPAAMQAKLLRVLQEGELERVGGTETLKVDVRVDRGHQQGPRGGDRRRALPRGPLLPAERRADPHARRCASAARTSPPGRRLPRRGVPEERPAAAAAARPRRWRCCARYDCPGNVRELRNLVERLAILCEGPVVTGRRGARSCCPRRAGRCGRCARGTARRHPRRWRRRPRAAPRLRVRVDKPFRDQVDDAEREIILRALAFTRDNATEAARLLDLERGHFYKKMKALGIRRPRAQTPEATDTNPAGDEGTGSSEAG